MKTKLGYRFDYNNTINIKQLKWEKTKFGCWEIISHEPCSGGYVQIIRNGILYQAHRFIWEKTYGPIPKDMCVLHSCDNPKCINPEHLFLVKINDNNQDMIRKGRDDFGGYK